MEQGTSLKTKEQTVALQRYLADLDQALEQGRTAIDALYAHRKELLGLLKNARERANDLAWELEEIEQRLRDLEQQTGGTPDLLLERELASVAKQRAVIEEQALMQMLLVDELTARWKAEELELSEQEPPWEERKAALLAERERITALLDQQKRPVDQQTMM